MSRQLKGQRGWPFLGAVYMIHAIKRVKGGTIIGPAWNRKLAVKPSAVPATNREKENTAA